MIINDIKERLGNGSKPFAIRLSDGRRFVVPQRDFIAFTANKIALFDQHGVSHIIVGQSHQAWWKRRLGLTLVHRMLMAGGDFDLHVVPLEEGNGG